MNQNYDIICIGMALVDSIIRGFDPEPVSASGYRAESGSLNVGGEAVNEAMAAAKLGMKTGILCSLGWYKPHLSRPSLGPEASSLTIVGIPFFQKNIYWSYMLLPMVFIITFFFVKTTLRCLWTSCWLLTNQFSREGGVFLSLALGSGLLLAVKQRLA